MRLAHKNRYQPKHLARSGDGADIYRALAPSVIGMALCAACLSGTTWAWFTATASTDVSAIQTAQFLITQQVGGSTSSGGPVDSTEWTLNAGANVVTLTPTGTATGYCMIEFEGAKYYTGDLTNTGDSNTDSFTFTVNATQGQTLVINERWGTFTGTANLTNGQTIGTETQQDASVSLVPNDGATQEELEV